MATIIGIDFGCSLCRTAVYRDGAAESFPNRFSERKLPLLIEEVDGALSFGSIKQSLGLVETAPAAHDLFHMIRQDAREATGEEIDAAVVTVPACFTERQRAALRKAAEEGGLPAVRLLDESTAALLATGLKPEKKNVLVYALGAGVFSASVFQTGGPSPRALWHEGNRNLGGNNFDAAIVALILERLGYTPSGFLDRKESAEKLKQLAENVKIGLSKRPSEDFDVNAGELFAEAAARKSPFSVPVSITREDLETGIAEMIDESIELAGHAVQGAGLEPARIDAVVLLGDSTRIPLVEKRLRELFSCDFVRGSKVAIARGAALHGSQLDEKAWEREKTQAAASTPEPSVTSSGSASPQWAGVFIPGFDKAQKLWLSGQQEMATTLLEALIEQMPKFVSKLYVIRGEHDLRHGDLDKALENFEHALKLDKSERTTQELYHRTCNLKAHDLFENHRYAEAKIAIRKGEQYVPNCRGCSQLLQKIDRELERARRGGPSAGWTPSRRRRR